VVPLLPVANYTLPVLVCLAGVWVAWRAVNVPTFGDFLIATEAEMNKVSWTTKKRLVQDTIVVLVCLALLTVFLFVIDIFWGWMLSLEFIGVLPKKSDTAGDAANLAGNLKW
jgi:preprotein translocase SecE subunit